VTGLVNEDLQLPVEYLPRRESSPQGTCASHDEENSARPRSGNDSGERVWQESRKWPSRTRFSAGREAGRAKVRWLEAPVL
jgi:hypothetical protein